MVRDNTLALVVGLVALAGAAGAANHLLGQDVGPPKTPTPTTHAEETPHARNILPAGDYHVEASIDRRGAVEIFVYGAKEGQLHPIPTTGLDLEVEAIVHPTGEDGVPVRLAPRPMASDPSGFTSRLVGRFARRPEQSEVGLALMLPIEGHTYRIQWRSEDLTTQDAAMPAARDSDTARDLFLTPGGLYSRNDIAANGGRTAVQAYGMQMSRHNAHPRPGDRLCPISETAANPKFAWVVGGKTYTFCCTPCIEEFVQRAKEKPESVRAPAEYVQR